MKYTFALLCFYISMVSAIQYYGFIPTEQQRYDIEKPGFEFNDGSTEIISLLATSHLNHKDESDFLASVGFQNMTLDDVFGSSVKHNSIEVRAPIDYVCYDSPVTERLGDNYVSAICSTLAAIASSFTVNTLAAVVKSTTCNATNNGQPVSCELLIKYVADAALPATFTQVKRYCPDFLNLFSNQCSGEGGLGGTGQVSMAETVTQKDKTCDDLEGKCAAFGPR